MKELDGWVEQLMECKQLTENQVRIILLKTLGVPLFFCEPASEVEVIGDENAAFARPFLLHCSCCTSTTRLYCDQILIKVEL